MANDKVCVFCGEKLSYLRTVNQICAGVYQLSCKSCDKELAGLSEEERCRRALKLGLAQQPEKLEAFIEVAANAETHRPACLRCGAKLLFQPVQYLDNSPMRDGIFSTTFDVLPARCPSCGKYEFYDPEIVEKNPYITRLMKLDTGE